MDETLEDQKEKIQEVTLDPAQQSLADALKTAFVVLKFTMIILLILYFFSGFFNVPQNQKAIRLRFGKYVGEDGVVEAGGPYPGLPYPLEEVFTIEVRDRQLELGDSFWFRVKDKDKGLPLEALWRDYQSRSLDPLRDGYLLMGDEAIIHAKWIVDYGIKNELKFAEFVGDDELANQLVTQAVEEAIVEKAANSRAEDWVKATNIGFDVIVSETQKVLDTLNSGIEIKRIGSLDGKPIYPVLVRMRVESVDDAVTSADRKVLDAQKRNINQLSVVAGENYEKLVNLINDYELLQSTGTEEEVEAISLKIEKVIRDLKFEDGNHIGGEVAKLITDAKSYKNQIKQKIETEYAVFSAINEQYKANPEVTKARLLEPMRERVLQSKDVETFYVAPGKLKLKLSKDPAIVQQRKKDQIAKAKKGGN